MDELRQLFLDRDFFIKITRKKSYLALFSLNLIVSFLIARFVVFSTDGMYPFNLFGFLFSGIAFSIIAQFCCVIGIDYFYASVDMAIIRNIADQLVESRQCREVHLVPKEFIGNETLLTSQYDKEPVNNDNNWFLRIDHEESIYVIDLSSFSNQSYLLVDKESKKIIFKHKC